MMDKTDKVEENEFVMTKTLRKELNDFAEFMFLMLQPKAYKEWKAEQEEELEAAEGAEYEYVELPDVEKEDFEKLVMEMNKLPSFPVDDDDMPDLISPLEEDGSIYRQDDKR